MNNISFLGPDEVPQRAGALSAPGPSQPQQPQQGGAAPPAYWNITGGAEDGSFLLPLEVAWALGKGAAAAGGGVGAGAPAGGALAAARAAAAAWVSSPYAQTWDPSAGRAAPAGSIQGNASRFVRTFDARFGYQVVWVKPGQVIDIVLQNAAALNGESSWREINCRHPVKCG